MSSIDEARDKLIELYKDIDAHRISGELQAKLNHFYNANVYGEVTLGGFEEMLQHVEPQKDEVFYDLGSGAGVPVLLASLLYPFSKCIGVELHEDLHLAAVEVQKRHGDPRLTFINSDFNEVDFSDGDVIFMNSVYFYYELKHASFLENIKNLKEGARIISVITAPISPYLDSMYKGSELFTWGEAAYEIQVRNSLKE